MKIVNIDITYNLGNHNNESQGQTNEQTLEKKLSIS